MKQNKQTNKQQRLGGWGGPRGPRGVQIFGGGRGEAGALEKEADKLVWDETIAGAKIFIPGVIVPQLMAAVILIGRNSRTCNQCEICHAGWLDWREQGPCEKATEWIERAERKPSSRAPPPPWRKEAINPCLETPGEAVSVQSVSKG